MKTQRHTQREYGHMKTEAEIGGNSKLGRSKEGFISKAFRRTMALPVLMFRLLASRIVKE